MPETKLLPCPFCGGEAFHQNNATYGHPEHTVICETCQGEGPHFELSKENAIKKWNERKGQKGLVWITREEIKKLSKADALLEDMKDIARGSLQGPIPFEEYAISRAKKAVKYFEE